MKYTCRKCGGSDPCFIDFGDAPAPEYCPCDGERVVWREVTELAALPKLTVEELERRGIEWPKWAGCAAVNPDKGACFMDSSSELYPTHKANKWIGKNDWEEIPGKWDATDWKNSKIMRPVKVKQLPDWLKLGAWAAVDNFVGRIDWINRDASECRITCGESRFAKTGEVKPVTWRAWNDNEMKQQVGKVFKGKKHDHLCLVVECGFGSRSSLFIGCGEIGHMAEEVLENYEQLNGLPCGVPQVDGADLEG